MKKINNKGFALLETLVVSVFVIVAFMVVYRNGLPLIYEYNKLENYDDIDSLYAANLIKEFLLSESDWKRRVIFQNFSSNSVKYLDLTNCSNFSVNDNKCQKVVDYFDIDSIILTKSDPSILKYEIDHNRFKENIVGFASYVDYLNNRYVDDFSSNNYMIIVGRIVTTENGYLDENDEVKFENVSVLKFGSIGVTYNE